MAQIIVADDHLIVRAGLKQILSQAHDIEAAGEAEDGRMLLDRIRKDEFDAVLLGLTMPGMDGLDVLKQVKTEHPGLPVIILTIHPEKQYALHILRAGASGYLR